MHYVCAHCHEELAYDPETGKVGPCSTHEYGQVLLMEGPLDP